ncbi:hypothetical protein BDW60DRAFT_86291 [Aspergillus nidulans var. acristatus]|jgi:hypothetical protein
MAIFTYMLEYVDGTDILDEENLRDGYKQFYHALKLGDPTMCSILEDLRRDFKGTAPPSQTRLTDTTHVV